MQAAEITYGGDSISAAGYYMAAWLQTGIQANVQFRQEPELPAGVHGVLIKSSHLHVILSASGDRCMRLRIGEHEQQVALAGLSAYELMREELTVLGPDRVFDSIFDRAKAMQRQ
jgi:hypothetical protein